MVPRALLICCEGKTEQRYFTIVQQLCRIPAYVAVQILDKGSQHESLIEKTVEERAAFLSEHELDADDVETWAVCDHDKMHISYAELLRMAEENDLRLAFSRPQFEILLLQHFEQSSEHSSERILERLAIHKEQYANGMSVEDIAKADLQWLENALMDKPKRLRTAITNASQREKQSSNCFITAHHLIERFIDLGSLKI